MTDNALHTVCTLCMHTNYTVCTRTMHTAHKLYSVHTMHTAHNAVCTLCAVCVHCVQCAGPGDLEAVAQAAAVELQPHIWQHVKSQLKLLSENFSHVWRKKEGCSCHCLKSLEWRFRTFCKMQIKNKIHLCPRRNRKSQDIPTLHKNMRIVNFCCGMLEASKVPPCENSSNCGQFAERWKSENGNHCNW